MSSASHAAAEGGTKLTPGAVHVDVLDKPSKTDACASYMRQGIQWRRSRAVMAAHVALPA